MTKKIYVVTPCYNDFESLGAFLRDMDGELGGREDLRVSVVVVNDGSTENAPKNFAGAGRLRSVADVQLINLIGNVGHQRAISVGLAHVNSLDGGFDGVVVMDCDGEDKFEDALRMIDECREDEIVFAKRRKRSEGLMFRAFYILYKMIFNIFTGRVMYGGNFSFIPRALLNRVCHIGDIWNHYHAGVLKSKLKLRYVDCDRGARFHGKSKMNFVTLAVHGFSSVSVFNENVFVRLIMSSLFILGLGVLVIAAVLVMKFAFDAASPGWVTTIVGVILIICIQSLLSVLNFAFLSLGARNSANFVPARDYAGFIMNIETLSCE